MRKMLRPLIDTILGWTVSKKLSVWIVGTIMVFTGVEISDNWLILSGIYLGIQGTMDVLKEKVKRNNNEYEYIEEDIKED